MARERWPGMFGNYLASEIQYATLVEKGTAAGVKHAMRRLRSDFISVVMDYSKMRRRFGIQSRENVVGVKCYTTCPVCEKKEASVEVMQVGETKARGVKYLFSEEQMGNLERTAWRVIEMLTENRLEMFEKYTRCVLRIRV